MVCAKNNPFYNCFVCCVAVLLISVSVWRETISFRETFLIPRLLAIVSKVGGHGNRTSENQSTVNSPQQTTICRIPQLQLHDPTIRRFIKRHSKLSCASQKNWVFTRNGRIYIDTEVAAALDNVKCAWTLISRRTDHTNRRKQLGYFTNGTRLPGDVVTVACTADGGHSYSNLHVGVAYNRTLHERPMISQGSNSNATGMNVYVYLLDSISRMNFMRKLPNFYNFLVKKMDAVVLEGFNIVGDGTPWTLIPMLTGHFQTELYEGRKRFANASYLDNWPLVFKKFSDTGYITSFGEEQASYSFFSYKLKGFLNAPVDHYLRVFLNELGSVRKKHKQYCLGDRPRSIILCDWWKEQQEMYVKESIKTFSLLFSSETSHDDDNSVQVLDEHWVQVFSNQFSNGYFNNTLLIVMGDHGRRFGAMRQTQTGKTEEKLPFLSIVPPPGFKLQHPQAWRNLQRNAKHLVTPFDIHETLLTVLDLKLGNIQIKRPYSRGISLFNQIPEDRTCGDASIKPHFCTCLGWVNIPDLTSPNLTKIANFVIGKINNLLQHTKGLCRNLTLNRVENAQRMTPSDSMLSFKESADYDNIFPDLTADKSVAYEFYQVKFKTDPGNGIFESTVTVYDMEEGKLSFDFSDLSRVNSFHSYAQCVINTHHNLRQFCVCNNVGVF